MMIPASKEREAIRHTAMKAKREYLAEETPHDVIIRLVDALSEAMSVVEMKQKIIESTQKMAERFRDDAHALEGLMCDNCTAEYLAIKKVKKL